MSDVFISYARSTRTQAREIAGRLRAMGYDVWRDDLIPAHRAYGPMIEEHLAAARAVVVVWSPDANRSEWVRSQASRARAASKLVQLTVDKTPLPMPFDQIECANLAGWRGEPEAVAQGPGQHRSPDGAFPPGRAWARPPLPRPGVGTSLVYQTWDRVEFSP